MTKHLLTDDWQLAVGDNRFVLTAPDFYSADKFIQKQTDKVLQWLANWGFSECLVFYPNCQKPYRIPASLGSEVIMTQSIYLPGIQLDSIKLSLPLLRVFEEFLEFSDRRYCLIRRSDQRQLAVSEAVRSQVLKSGVSLEEVVKRRRQEYWHLPNLEDWQRVSRELEPNNQNSRLEYSYIVHDTTCNNWRRFTSEFRLIQCPVTQVIYEISQGLDVVPVASPIS
jgi:hypothetical protein